MKDINRNLLSIICIFFISSCNKKVDENSDIGFRYYNLESKGWKSRLNTQKLDNFNFTAVEVPIQYYLLKELGPSKLANIDSIYEENKTERIIEFTFEENSSKDVLQKEFTKLDYQAAVKYISFVIQSDFYAVSSHKDTVKCSGVLFERNFKVAPKTKILLFFTGIDPAEKIQLVYNDNLFQKGIIKFNFTDAPLNL